MIKKEDHNAGVSNRVEKFLIENLIKIKNFENGALSKNLIKTIEKYFIKKIYQESQKSALSCLEKYLIEKNTLSRSQKCLKKYRIKKNYQES